MNSTFLTICIALMTLGIWVGLGFLISTLIQVHRAAKAMEILAYKIEESVTHIHDASLKFNDFTDRVRSGWMRALEMVVGAATTIWQHRTNSREQESDKTSTRSE